MITLEIVQSTDRFRAIAPAWDALWVDRAASVFQAHAWVAAWHQHFTDDYDLLIGLAWDGDQLRTVLSCTAHRFRRVRLLEWAAQTLSDYCDAVGDPSNLPALLTEVLRVGHDTRWAFDNGFTEIDYLRGEETYKFEFANDRAALRSYVWGCSLKGGLALKAFQVGRSIRSLQTGSTETKSSGGAYSTQAGTSRLGNLKSFNSDE
jgi:CelD/BcsL family acetyltransferase involved in cellulose biosynthesis